jgi:hypothetical protein
MNRRVTMSTKTGKGSKMGKLTAAEDHILERWASACGHVHECDLCPFNTDCQKLADKLVGKVHLITQSGATAYRGRVRQAQQEAVCAT